MDASLAPKSSIWLVVAKSSAPAPGCGRTGPAGRATPPLGRAARGRRGAARSRPRRRAAPCSDSIIVRGVTSSMRQASAGERAVLLQGLRLVGADKAEAQRVRLHRIGHGLPGCGRHRRAPGRRRCGWCGASGSARTAGPWPRSASGTRRMRATGRPSTCCGPKAPSGKSVISARWPRSRAARSSSSRKVPWLIMIWREYGSVSGSSRVAVAAQHDLARLAQVHQPGLQVVRMRRQDGVAQHPAAQVGLVARALPGGHGLRRHGAGAAADAGRGSHHHAPAGDANELATMHVQTPCH